MITSKHKYDTSKKEKRKDLRKPGENLGPDQRNKNSSGKHIEF
jgi:hypothetical protein